MTNSDTRAERRARLEAAGAFRLAGDDVPSVELPTLDPYTPTIPPRVRDAAYIGGLVVSAAVAVTVPTVSAIVPDAAGIAAQIGTAVLSGVGILVSGLGVVYRPGAQR